MPADGPNAHLEGVPSGGSMRDSVGRWRRTLGAIGLSLALSLPVWAQPHAGDEWPAISSRDLRDQPHSSAEWRGRRTLVVVITDKDAGDEMRRWFDAANERLPPEVRRASILSLKLPFFASAGMARSKARDQVPEQFWGETWLDRNGAMAKSLGLDESRVPYVFVLDEQGRVLASVHATTTNPGATEVIWSSLGVR